jgi:hypothetical protein
VIVRIGHPYARYYRDRGRVHIDHRYRPSDYNRPVEIRRHRSVHVERTRVRVIHRD